MSMQIRPARPDDEAGVTALWRRCGLVASYNDPAADFRFALAGPASVVLVAEAAEGTIVGTTMVGHDGHRGWLYYVAAAPDRRRQGIGRAMVEAGEGWLRSRGVVKAQLMIRDGNRAVAPFYEALGYEDMPRVLMGKWLSGG